MTDTEFQAVVDATLVQVEEYIESLVDTLDLDADSMRSGNVLTLDFEDKGKMILNSQVANHELWLAAKSGVFIISMPMANGWTPAAKRPSKLTLLNC